MDDYEYRDIIHQIPGSEARIRKVTKPYALAMALQHLKWKFVLGSRDGRVIVRIRRIEQKDCDEGAWATLHATPDRIAGSSLVPYRDHWDLCLPPDFAGLLAVETHTKLEWGG